MSIPISCRLNKNLTDRFHSEWNGDQYLKNRSRTNVIVLGNQIIWNYTTYRKCNVRLVYYMNNYFPFELLCLLANGCIAHINIINPMKIEIKLSRFIQPLMCYCSPLCKKSME